ncbi:MAG: agmatine deiminase family protein, partial [Lachnospiraceae bacterium]|nr:agmatine deiminase family protein [Lachnospiraceae bacterium]
MIKDPTPSNDGFYMPAEFEPHEATIMVFPERPGSWPHGAKPAQRVFAKIIKEIAASEKVYVAVNDRTLKTAKTLLSESVSADGELLPEAVTADGELPDRAIEGKECDGKLTGNIVLLNIPTDDAWARDIAPTFVRSRNGRSVRGI